jgi:uncharacterized membrane protein
MNLDLRDTASDMTVDAKHPVTAAAGPYGHPFHPMLVTLPIGAWTMSVVFDVVRLAGGEDRSWAVGAFWLVVFGILGAGAAAVFGLLDLLAIPRGTRAFATGVPHMALNVAALGLFAASALSRAGTLDSGDVPGVATALSLVAFVVLGASGWLGGKLAYHYGVRVADEATQAEGFARR